MLSARDRRRWPPAIGRQVVYPWCGRGTTFLANHRSKEDRMIKKWIFAAGAGLGYVLGTRAGREKYDKMRAQARNIMENPKVKETTDEAARLVEEGRLAVRDKMRKLNHRDDDELLPSTVGSSASTAPTTATGSVGSTTYGTTSTSPSNGARLDPPGTP
jgi:hypothetical protein